jgi:protein-L-isoaspartate(D-aspartate) O-methyltransferase
MVKEKADTLGAFTKSIVSLCAELKDERVIKAISSIEREPFFPPDKKKDAYSLEHVTLDGYSISQPSLVAFMIQVLCINSTDKVLDIGCGSGYQAALISRLAKEVYGVEILPHAFERASKSLKEVGCNNVTLRLGDGSIGWEEYAPFDAITVACGMSSIPYQLISQLKTGGKIIFPFAPEGKSPYDEAFQNLVLLEKLKEGYIKNSLQVYPKIKMTDLMPVRFMVMTT